ncbi:Ethylmalonyl-CoA/methylmalonyl-CoA epimerase [subsurface metagenome]
MNVKKVDHIAMLVKDMESLIRVFTEVLNLKVSKQMEFPQDKIKVAFLDLGELQLEVIQPTGPGTPFARHMEAKGQGLHHLALEVDDIEAALQTARESGLKLEDEVPRPGAGGQIAYLDLETTSGIYLQFVQK